MYWLKSKRSYLFNEIGARTSTYDQLRAIARSLHVHLEAISTDDIIIAGSPERQTVYVRGRPADPSTTFFHTKLVTWPQAWRDIWPILTTCKLLQSCGFYTTISNSLNIALNDKLATVVGLGDDSWKWLPTVRIPTRNLDMKAIGSMDFVYPVLMKPADWGGGFGITRACDWNELRSLLQLASASGITVIVQRDLGPHVFDCGIYVIRGSAYKAVVRKRAPGAYVGSMANGGSAQVVDVPIEYVAPAERIASRLGLSYFRIDVLGDGQTTWISEVEPDGEAIGFSVDLTRMRFEAYLSEFERFRRA
ncbi:RimK family alpha-L-glutamate ligase [Nocardia asteroides]|uniref:RimK family alpha-L-glutamate ligase n=1 Tax=Nocardia asteroides TaxID=1824 RepID=UPI00378F4E1A